VTPPTFTHGRFPENFEPKKPTKFLAAIQRGTGPFARKNMGSGRGVVIEWGNRAWAGACSRGRCVVLTPGQPRAPTVPSCLWTTTGAPHPSGYSDIQIEIDVAPGMKAELQIHIPEMLAAKEGNEVKKMGVPERYWPEKLNIRGLDPERPGHSFYEIERDLLAPEQERARATEHMAELYADARAAYERRTQARLAISARNAASSTSFAPSISEGRNRIGPLPAGPQTNGLPPSTTTGSPSSSFQNLAPGSNFSGSSIDPPIQPGSASDNGKPAITAQNVKEFTGTLAVNPNALPESGMWNVFDRAKFDAAEGAEVVPVSQLICRRQFATEPDHLTPRPRSDRPRCRRRECKFLAVLLDSQVAGPQ
jgi:hypothetical protein